MATFTQPHYSFWGEVVSKSAFSVILMGVLGSSGWAVLHSGVRIRETGIDILSLFLRWEVPWSEFVESRLDEEAAVETADGRTVAIFAFVGGDMINRRGRRAIDDAVNLAARQYRESGAAD